MLALKSDSNLPLGPYALFDTRLDWAVLPELETVDGVDCHVVRANTAQRIWIDVKSQFAVRFRQLHFRIENVSSEEWPIGIQYRFKDFDEVDGIPMPYKCMMVSCGTPSDPKSLWGKPLRSSVIVVDKLSLNESVAEEIFSLSYPPGTEVRDPVHDRFYRLGDDGEELALLVAVSEEKLNEGVGRSRLFFVLINATFIGALLAVFAAKKLKAKKA